MNGWMDIMVERSNDLHIPFRGWILQRLTYFETAVCNLLIPWFFVPPFFRRLWPIYPLVSSKWHVSNGSRSNCSPPHSILQAHGSPSIYSPSSHSFSLPSKKKLKHAGLRIDTYAQLFSLSVRKFRSTCPRTRQSAHSLTLPSLSPCLVFVLVGPNAETYVTVECSNVDIDTRIFHREAHVITWNGLGMIIKLQTEGEIELKLCDCRILLFISTQFSCIRFVLWTISRFLVSIPAWQVEELSCANDFVHDKILQKWQEIEDNLYAALVAGNSSDWDVDRKPAESRWESERFFSHSVKIQWHQQWQKYIVTLSISDLREIFTSQHDILLQNVQKHLFHLPHDFLSQALDEDSYHSALITTELREHKWALANGVKFQFRGDIIDKPNEAWLWAHEYQPCDLYVQSHWEYAIGEGLRRFGIRILG